ncbi:DNA polymerase Y family protein [Acetobacteraceae bacterium H6797]|nr:DNA polymerase Y family protein [Acetobacteraceae bacterium H6797]
MSGRRYLALWLPLLPIDRLQRLDPKLRGQPLAIWTTTGSRRHLTACIPMPGIEPGQALADAQAIRPDLLLHPAEPEADAQLLERLAHWCLRWTPLVALDGGDGLLLDTTGADPLFGGETALLEAVLRGFREGGFHAEAAMAGSPGTAAALARGGESGRVLPPGQERDAMAPLLLHALRVPEATITALSRLGLRYVRDLQRQPRAPLLRRFGASLLDLLDDATGERPRLFRPLYPPPAFQAARNLLEPIITRAAIDQVLAVLLEDLCRQLADAGQGARRLVLQAFRVDRTVQRIAIGTGAASRHPAHLARLFTDRLDGLEPDLGFDRMTLDATMAQPMSAQQDRLTRERGEAGGSLTELLDRLEQRAAVTRPLPLDSHWPEYAAAPAGPFDTPKPAEDWGREIRPLRLLREPVPLAVTTLTPDGRPASFQRGRALYRVLRALGPETLEPEWWGSDGGRPGRDYFRVQTVEGPRFWICRLKEQSPRWFLHGEMA